MSEHGVLTTYVNGKCRCTPCRAVNAAYNRWRRAARKAGRLTGGQKISSVGTVRRVHALNRIGWSTPQVFRRAGLGERGRESLRLDMVKVRTAAAIAAVYDALSVTPPPESTWGERVAAARTRARAEREGWADPFAWEGIDMDDPDAVPDVSGMSDPDGWMIQEFEHLTGCGMPTGDAIRALNRRPGTLARAADRAGRPDLAKLARAA